MNGVPAWVLEIDTSTSVAVGQYEIAHIISQANLVAIAQAPEYCKFVTIWNNCLIPVFNITHWLSPEKPSEYHSIIAIMAFKLDNGDVSHGGIQLSNPPVLAHISNDQQCELPDNADKWKNIAISCFRSSNGQAVPILNIKSLFQNRPHVYTQHKGTHREPEN